MAGKTILRCFPLPSPPPIIQSLLALLTPFALLLLEGKKRAKLLGLLGVEKKDLRGQLTHGTKLFLFTFAALLAQTIVLAWLGLADNEKVVEVLQQQSALTLLAIVFLAPVGEELLFRGYLQKKLGFLARNAAAGVVLSSILFAVLHARFGSVAEIAGAFTASIIFGVYVNKNKLVIPAIVAHALVNLYAVAVALATKQ